MGALTIKTYISLSRPKNWLKNIFIFVPLVFSLELFNLIELVNTVVVFAAFCLVASAVYAFNDICDAAKDAQHPIKRTRPIASGALTKKQAARFAILLVIVGFTASIYISPIVGALLAAYITLNLSYSLWLKYMPLIDCFCIAAGFVLRVYIGSAASGEPVSDWLFLTIVAMSLFMAFGKRHGELAKNEVIEKRESLRQLNMSFLQGMVFTCAGLSVVFYSLWAITRGHYIIYTVPLIIFIVARFLMLIYNSDSYGDPTTVVFGDKGLLFTAVLYIVLTVLLLYTGGA